MSANVWFQEVDTAFMKEIYDTVRHRDPYTEQLIRLDESNGVIVRKPEEDFKFEVFPCVSIYNLYYAMDKQRYNPNPVVVERNIAEKKAIMEEPAVTFTLSYQLDFWARYYEDMGDITRTWMAKHFRQFNLPVVDDGGVLRSCNVFMSENPKKNDLLVKNDRLFRTIFSYKIWVELDDETRYNEAMVLERGIEAEEKEDD